MTHMAATPGPWTIAPTVRTNTINIFGIAKHREYHVGTLISGSNKDVAIFRANARLIAAAPRLLKTLEMAEQAIEEATDIMHYEDGQPVTALDSWEIERAYTALCSVLVQVHQAVAAAKGEKP